MFFLCRRYSWHNIAQIKTLCSVVQDAPNNIAPVKALCNVVLKAPDNTAQENVLFHVVLKLFGQQSTGQNTVWCCPRGSRQHCIKKTPVQCILNTLGSILNRSKPYVMLSQRVQTTLPIKKSCSMLS